MPGLGLREQIPQRFPFPYEAILHPEKKSKTKFERHGESKFGFVIFVLD